MDTCACVNTRTSTAQRCSTLACVDHALRVQHHPVQRQPVDHAHRHGHILELTCDFNSSIDYTLTFYLHCQVATETERQKEGETEIYQYTLKKLKVGSGNPDARHLMIASSPSMPSVSPGPSNITGGTETQKNPYRADHLPPHNQSNKTH